MFLACNPGRLAVGEESGVGHSALKLRQSSFLHAYCPFQLGKLFLALPLILLPQLIFLPRAEPLFVGSRDRGPGIGPNWA